MKMSEWIWQTKIPLTYHAYEGLWSASSHSVCILSTRADRIWSMILWLMHQDQGLKGGKIITFSRHLASAGSKSLYHHCMQYLTLLSISLFILDNVQKSLWSWELEVQKSIQQWNDLLFEHTYPTKFWLQLGFHVPHNVFIIVSTQQIMLPHVHVMSA